MRYVIVPRTNVEWYFWLAIWSLSTKMECSREPCLKWPNGDAFHRTAFAFKILVDRIAPKKMAENKWVTGGLQIYNPTCRSWTPKRSYFAHLRSFYFFNIEQLLITEQRFNSLSMAPKLTKKRHPSRTKRFVFFFWACEVGSKMTKTQWFRSPAGCTRDGAGNLESHWDKLPTSCGQLARPAPTD